MQDVQYKKWVMNTLYIILQESEKECWAKIKESPGDPGCPSSLHVLGESPKYLFIYCRAKFQFQLASLAELS